MSKISESEIQNAAKLARIKLNPNELESMTLEVGEILKFVETIQAIDVSGVLPTSQVTGLHDIWRKDEVIKSDVPPEDLLAGAPELQDGYVKVKKVL